MDRRHFLKTMAATGMLACMGEWQEAYARGKADKWVGKKWKGWKKGEFQDHFIYTGVAESMFYIFPDGTTMLLDCGDHNAIGRGKKAVPILPNSERHSGEWIARYVERVNPQGHKVDYMMLSHYHSDHAGCSHFHAGMTERGERPWALSGFAQASETLSFGKAFDRCWPDYTDPIPLDLEGKDSTVRHMKQFYEYMHKERGMDIEKFREGAINQVSLLRQPQEYPDFSIRNICANGRIAAEDGTIKDLYADYIAQKKPQKLNENGMSLGMIIHYGPFRFYTAGDFSDTIKMPDGTKIITEEAIAQIVPTCQVSKINHHGHYSMPAKLIQALQSRVYISCVWDQLHNVAPVMARLADHSLYSGDRIVCPGIFPKERRAEDAGSPWLNDLAGAAFDGGHIILNVEKGGKNYSIIYLTAEDESMEVKSVMHFKS